MTATDDAYGRSRLAERWTPAPKNGNAIIQALNAQFEAFNNTLAGMVKRQINKELIELPFRTFEFNTGPQSALTLTAQNQTKQQTRIRSIAVCLDNAVTAASLKLDDQTTIPIPINTQTGLFFLSDIDFIVKGQNRVLTWTGGTATNTYGLFICGWAIPSQLRELA